MTGSKKLIHALQLQGKDIIPCDERSVNMSRRRAMKARKDKRVYTQTAKHVKKINLAPKVSRGGIRL